MKRNNVFEIFDAVVAENGFRGRKWRCFLSQFEKELALKFGEFEGEKRLASVRKPELILAAGEFADERDEFLLQAPLQARRILRKGFLFWKQIFAKRQLLRA